MVLGKIIGAGASIAGSLIGSKSSSSNARAANQANIKATRLTNRANRKEAKRARRYNRRMVRRARRANRKDAALAWKRTMSADATKVQRLVKDAKAAGISPLAAMGNTAPGAVPATSAGIIPHEGSRAQAPEKLFAGSGIDGTAIGNTLAQLATSTIKTPTQQIIEDLQLEKLAAEVNLVEAQARQVSATATSRTLANQNNTPEIITLPLPPVPTATGNPTQIIRTPLGNYKAGRYTPASVVEDLYSDIWGNVHGLGAAIGDTIHNAHEEMSALMGDVKRRLLGVWE